jgi:hypothetical protein
MDMKRILLSVLICICANVGWAQSSKYMWQYPLQLPDTGSYVVGYENVSGVCTVKRFRLAGIADSGIFYGLTAAQTLISYTAPGTGIYEVKGFVNADLVGATISAHLMLRVSYTTPNGTARTVAMTGNYGTVSGVNVIIGNRCVGYYPIDINVKGGTSIVVEVLFYTAGSATYDAGAAVVRVF